MALPSFPLLIGPVILLIVTSAILILLERITSSTFATHTAYDTHTGSPAFLIPQQSSPANASSTSTAIAIDVNSAPVFAYLGAVILAAIAGVLIGCAIWELRRVEGRPGAGRSWAWCAFLAGIVNLGVCVGVLGWTSALQGSEQGWKSASDVGSVEPGSGGWTRETWVCSLDRIGGSGWAGNACRLAQATRLLFIPIILFTILALLSTILLIRTRGGIPWLFGGRGRYAGFKSVYEQQGPPPSYPLQNYGHTQYQGQGQVYTQAPYANWQGQGQGGMYVPQGMGYGVVGQQQQHSVPVDATTQHAQEHRQNASSAGA